MRVTNFQTNSTEDFVRFSADFQFADDSRNSTIWFEVQKDQVPQQFFPEDTFLCAAYPLALKLQEDLVFDGSISQLLLDHLPQIGPQIGVDVPPIHVFSKNIEKRKKQSEHTSQFFTLGADSFYTLLDLEKKNQLKNHTLLYAFGYDVQDVSQSLIKKIKKNIAETSKYFSIKHLFVSTNLRKTSESILDWGYYHGAGLAAVAHLFPHVFGSVFFNSSSIHTEGVAWGSHLYLDHLWSTEDITCTPYGTDTQRVDKIGAIANHKDFPFVSTQLRVCWNNLGQKNAPYNCSACEKCLRTHLAFAMFGQRNLKTFKPINLKHLRNFHIKNQDKYHWRALYNLSLRKLGSTSDISQAILALLNANQIKPYPTDSQTLLIADISTTEDGFSHINDEAILRQTHAWYAEHFPEGKYGLLSRSLSHSDLGIEEHLHLPFPFGSWQSRIYLVKLISKDILHRLISWDLFHPEQHDFFSFVLNFDTFNFAGGYNFDSRHQPQLYYMLWLLYLGKTYGKKIVLTSQRLGPFTFIDTLFARMFLKEKKSWEIKE